MNIVFAVGFTGTPDADDVLAAKRTITVENSSRLRYNQSNPEATQKTMLLFGSAAEIKASYLSLFLEQVTARHLANIVEAKSEPAIKERFTPAQFAQIMLNLNTRLEAGETTASVVADTASL